MLVMPTEFACRLLFDASVALELLPAAEYFIETGAMTEEEASETLAQFV